MKPWITEPIGTQKVDLPSSVVQALLATSEKFFMLGKSFSGARLPRVKSCSEASNGRQVMMSPAVPACSLASSAALYSFGAVGLNSTAISGCLAMKAGMIFCFQMSASSLRQLSIESFPAEAPPLSAALASAASRTDFKPVFNIAFSLGWRS